jgi:hypothetical protein
MKNLALILMLIVISISNSFGQNQFNAFNKEGKIFIQFDTNDIKEIVSEGENVVLGFCQSKNFVVYKVLEQKSNSESPDAEGSFDQYSVRLYDLSTNKSTILFTTCLDGEGGTMVSYGKSNIFPNENLCGLQSAQLTKDGEKLFFQTDGWVTCAAIHYFDIKQNKLVFYKAGWLMKVNENNVEVQVTGIETINNHGKIESKGRYVQTCLFDMNGKLIKNLTEKEF